MSKNNTDAAQQSIFIRAQARLSITKNGYQLGSLIESNLNYILYKHPPAGVVYRSALKKFFLIPGFRHMPLIKAGTLFTFPEWTQRKDYQEILDYASADVKDKFICRLSSLPLKAAFNLKNLVLAIRLARGTGLSFLARLYITSSFYNYLLMIDDAERHIRAEVNKYVSFSCVMGAENLLTQYFKKRGIPTCNLQHGITYIYEKNFSDEIEYHNLITDHHLAWGEYTRDQLVKYGMPAGQISVAGYPRSVSQAALKAPSGKSCLVFLTRQHFHPANIKIFTMLAAFNNQRSDKFIFTFKYHPSLNLNELQHLLDTRFKDAGFRLLRENNSMQQVLGKEHIDFCIAVNSTAYYESYIHGIPALRFKDSTFDMSHAIADDTFGTGEELSALTDSLYNNFEEIFSAEAIRRELNYVLGLDKNDYWRLLS